MSARPDSAASLAGSPRLAPSAGGANGELSDSESPARQDERETSSRLEVSAKKTTNELASSSAQEPRPSSAAERPKPKEPQDVKLSKHVDEDTLSRLESPAPKTATEAGKPALPPKPTNVPARAGTLSWQQRPGSLRGVRSRPISLAADRAPSPLTKSASVPEPESMSRDAIAKSLGAKDALFFRQTADRGTNSAAYRKNQVEDTDVVDLSANRMRLHGLGGSSQQAEKEKEEEETTEPAVSSPLASPPPSGLGKPRMQTPVGRSNTVRASWASPLPTQASQVFSPAGSPESAIPYSSATLGRPGSPSKGIGSFVQSAMAKRSDSVSKRWSAQTSPSVSRANSVAASRDTLGTAFGGSPEAGSKRGAELNDPQSPEPTRKDRDDVLASPPSPSKRFSPVKASWLESALARPESPNVSTGPQQPSWLAELHRNKMQRSSVDVTGAMKESGVDKVSSSASIGGRSLAETKAHPALPEKKPKPASLEKPAEAAKENAPEIKATEPTYISETVKSKPKPVTPPKKDFRSTLKPRETTVDTGNKSELEFRNAVGKLKRTVTEKYVAPDILKDNITRGKAGLALTDGPQKSPTKDEFKDSLLKQKETMQAKGGEPSRSRSTSPVKRSTTPEAIAKRRTLASKASAPNMRAVAASEAAEELEAKKEAPVLPVRNTIVSPQPLRKEPAASSKLAERFNPNLASMLARGPSPFVPSEAPSGRATPSRQTETSSDSPETGDSRLLQHMTKARAKGPKRRAPKAETSSVAAAQEARPPLPRKSSATVRSVSSSKPRVASSSLKVNSSAVVAEAEPKPIASLSEARKSQTWPTEASSTTPVNQTTNGASNTPHTIKSSTSVFPPKPLKPNGLRSTSGTNSSVPTEDEEKEHSNGNNEASAASESGTSGLSVRGAAAKWGRPMTMTMDKKKEAAPLSSPIEFTSAKAQRSTSSSSLLVPTDMTVDAKPSTSSRTPQPAAKPASLSLNSAGSTVKTPVTAKTNGTSSTTSSTSSPIPRTTEAGRIISDFFQNPSGARTHLDVDTSAILTANSTQDTSKLKTLRKTIVELHHDGTTTSLPLQQDHVLFSASTYLCTHIFGNATTGARTTELYLWSGMDVSPTHIAAATSHAKAEAKKASATFIHLLQDEEVISFLQALGGILVTRDGSFSMTQNKPYLLRGRRHFGHLTFDEVDLASTSLCPGFPCILVPGSGSKGATGSGSGPDKIYLWKGTGAHHEEVAGARLMAMDIGSLADIIEVDCGAETPEFLSFFPKSPSTSKASTAVEYAAYWSQKSKSENYRVRLFEISSSSASAASAANEALSTVSAFWRAAAGKSSSTSNNNNANTDSASASASSTTTSIIKEITPFSQSSLTAGSIYVLDAYFALYIIVGPLAQQGFQAFSSALLFAQDYAILAASGEDRPSVPKGWVVFPGGGGLGVDVKACFRWWDEEKVGTEELMAGRARGRGMGAENGDGDGKVKMVPVDSCIAACKGV